jgi:hypothetical protein
VTDIRNFRQFVGHDIEDLKIDRESCSFRISPLGKVSLNIAEKEPLRKVVYAGSALSSNDFSLFLDIREGEAGKAEVMITLDAEMNPVLKMMAAKPVTRFLETLIDEMERFRDWNGVKE